MKKLPRQADVTQTSRQARAPYNFVPLPDAVVTVERLPPHHTYYDHWPTDEERRYNGYLDCELKTLTPFYTRCMMTPKFFEKHGEKAFHELDSDQQTERAKPLTLQEEPVILGSSLRGMVRNLVEIAGYGKMAWVTDQRLSYRSVDKTNLGEYYRHRVMKDEGKRKVIKKSKRKGKMAIHSTPLIQAGYLERQGHKWYIRPAQKIGETTFARILIDDIPDGLTSWGDCQNAYKIWVKLSKYDYQDVRDGFIQVKYTPVLEAVNSEQAGFKEAVLAYSGPMETKKREAVIFPPDKSAKLIEIDDKLIEAYQEQISQEQEKLLGKQGVLTPKQPVFYLVENKSLVFFGHVMMLRLSYPYTPNDFVPDHINAKTNLHLTDLAEAIFGYIDGTGDRFPAYASRIFVTDARFKSPAPDNTWKYDDVISPQVLSSPKPTTFQHYLTQNNPDSLDSLNHYATSPDETVIRGHKLYWHKGKTSLDNIKEQDGDKLADHRKQYTRIQPVKPGVSFSFKVNFENLNKAELGALLWVLDLPQGHRHKLGMGKPLGMGSVEIKPELYLCNRQTRYRSLLTDQGDNWQTGYNPQPEDDLQPYKDTFQQMVMATIENTGVADPGSFNDQIRVKTLLKLLEWPGPDKATTSYMELEAFEDRPVLPAPVPTEIAELDTSTLGSETGSDVELPPPPEKEPIDKQPEYPMNYIFVTTLEVVWNNKQKRNEIKMPNGELGVLMRSRKEAQRYQGEKLQLIVFDFKDDVYLVDLY